MSFRTMAAWAILIFIPLSGALILFHTDRVCTQTIELIEAAEKESFSDGSESISSALELWRRNDSFLSCFVTHEEINAVTEDLVRAKLLFSIKDEEEYPEVLVEAKVHAEIVKRFDFPSVKNIF